MSDAFVIAEAIRGVASTLLFTNLILFWLLIAIIVKNVGRK